MTTRRAFLVTGGAATLAGLAGCTGLGNDGGDGGDGNGSGGGGENGSDDGDYGSGRGTPGTPVETVMNAPLPDDPSAHTYARTSAGASKTVTYVGNWKCPFCAEFATGTDRVLSLGTIVEEHVNPGDLALGYRALSYGSDGDPFLGPDAPRAARAGLAVWNIDPESYWTYHEQVMGNQPPEDEEWATKSRLVEFAQQAGVSDPDAVGQAVEDGTYEAEVKANTEFAAKNDVSGTPSVVVGDSAYSPFKPDELRSALDEFSG
jgi:protein-disulfide isomerase